MIDNITVETINNGYLVRYYEEPYQGGSASWYCIDPQEVSDRVEKILMGKL